jgi:hypothetical protein
MKSIKREQLSNDHIGLCCSFGFFAAGAALSGLADASAGAEEAVAGAAAALVAVMSLPICCLPLRTNLVVSGRRDAPGGSGAPTGLVTGWCAGAGGAIGFFFDEEAADELDPAAAAGAATGFK